MEPENSSPRSGDRLRGRRAAVVLFSDYPTDTRPFRAAQALRSAGMDVDVICLQDHDGELRRETVGGVNVLRLRLRSRRGGKLTYLAQYAAFTLAAAGFLAVRSVKRRYDLVHVHNMPDLMVFSALVPKLFGARVILDLHDPMPELMMSIYNLRPQSFAVRILKLSEKWSLRFADLVLTTNLAFETLFVSRSCPPAKLQVIMNCPDEAVFPFKPAAAVPAPRDPARPFVILYHGCLVARHGLDFAIDALQRVRQTIPNAILMVCAKRTPYFEAVMKSVEQRGLQAMIRYLGMLDPNKIPEIIDQCDVGIVPNRRSIFTEINLPTRIFECLALAKPVIAPATRGIQDYFNASELLFFEPDNVADLARVIEFTATHPQAVQDILRRGQAVYLRHLWGREQARFLALVRNLLGVHSDASPGQPPVFAT